MSDNLSWQSNGAPGLQAEIIRLKTLLPGWWWTVCECQVSIEARIAPTIQSPHIALIRRAGDPFDEGFEVSLPQPTTCAEALRKTINSALEAVRERERA